MSRRALLFALALSLLFNLGFLVGWGGLGAKSATPADAPAAAPAGSADQPGPPNQAGSPKAAAAAADRDRPLHDLRLSREQRHRVMRAVGDPRALAEGELRQAHAELAAREALRVALVAQPFDQARARAAAAALADAQAQRTQRAQRALVETVAVLDDAQRAQVAERLASEDYRSSRWKSLRGRFDRDHDGKLDEAERTAAAQAATTPAAAVPAATAATPAVDAAPQR